MIKILQERLIIAMETVQFFMRSDYIYPEVIHQEQDLGNSD